MADFRRLPAPVTETWQWQMDAACREMDSRVFFHPDGERGPVRARREARAKRVCAQCPVLLQCRDHALTVHEPYGIWGGLSETERREATRSRVSHLASPTGWFAAAARAVGAAAGSVGTDGTARA